MPKRADRFLCGVAAAMLGVLLSAGPAAAQDAAAGRALAQQWCTSCHIVVPGADGSDAAPTFAAIANDPNVTERGLRAWLADPHPPMPNLNLSRTEIDNIIAYLKTLRDG